VNEFDDEPGLGAIVSVPVAEGREPARAVWHEHDGGWTMSCGTVDGDDLERWATTHVQHVLDHDATLHALGDLPVGWAAYRDEPGVAWERKAFSDEDA
jgi:hypothetical protein